MSVLDRTKKKIQTEKKESLITDGTSLGSTLKALTSLCNMLETENDKQEKIETHRYFIQPEGDEEGSWIEISKEEYYKLKER